MKNKLGQMLEAVRRQTGEGYKSVPAQALEIIRLYFLRGLHPSEYYAYGLASRQVSREKLDTYVSTKWYWRHHVPRLASRAWTPTLQNKWLFHLYFSQYRLTLPRTLGLFHESFGVTTDGQPLRNAQDLGLAIRAHNLGSLVSKPVGGTGGSGVMIFDRIDRTDAITCYTRVGTALTLDDLASELSAKGRNGHLIQERVVDHPFFQSINPYTASTIRVVTLRKACGAIHIPCASVRFGRQGSVVDNFGQGGISAAIEPGTGTIGEGMTPPRHNRRFVTEHPDSGVQFSGQVIPHWREILELCTLAARYTPRIHAVGWDVLLSAGGPVLLEGNHDWELSMQQVHNQGYLTSEVREFLNSYGVPVWTRTG